MATSKTKSIAKATPVKKGRVPHVVSFEEQRQTFFEKQVQEYNALNAVIVDRLGAAVPPFDPYILLAILDNNGYLMRGHRWKVAATVGVGYKCSPALDAHLKYANERHTFRQFLKAWALDVDCYGYAFHETQRGPKTVSFYNMAAIKTRVKPFNDGSRAYIHYEYGLGLVAYQEYEEFDRQTHGGVSMFNLPSTRGHLFYGDPEWIAARKAAELNVNIVDVGQKYFENSLISDMSITLKGAELDPDEREKIRQYLSNGFKGVNNAHKVLFFEVGPNEDVVFNKLNTELNDSSLKLRQENKEEVVVTNGVPQRLIGILTAGQLGGVGEVEGQMKVFKLGFSDDRQQDYTDYWQRQFDEAGLPDPESFEFIPMKIDSAAADLVALHDAAGAPILSVQEAHDEWALNKSLRDKHKSVDDFIGTLRNMRTLLEEERDGEPSTY